MYAHSPERSEKFALLPINTEPVCFKKTGTASPAPEVSEAVTA
jgi:hypothetical protein